MHMHNLGVGWVCLIPLVFKLESSLSIYVFGGLINQIRTICSYFKLICVVIIKYLIIDWKGMEVGAKLLMVQSMITKLFEKLINLRVHQFFY